MHTAIVLYLFKKESQLNEVCLGHKIRCTVFIRRKTRAQLLMIYKTATYFCPKDDRESLKKLNTSPGVHKSLFNTQQSKRKYFDSTVKIFKAKCVAVHHSNYFGCFIVSSHVGFREERIRTVSNYELSTLVQHSYKNIANKRSLCILISEF